MDRTFLFEQISAEFRLFEDISEKWAGKWHEAPIQERKTWGNLIRVLKERIQLYDDLVELDKRALEFVSTLIDPPIKTGEAALTPEEFATFKARGTMKVGEEGVVSPHPPGV